MKYTLYSVLTVMYVVFWVSVTYFASKFILVDELFTVSQFNLLVSGLSSVFMVAYAKKFRKLLTVEYSFLRS